MVSGATPGGGEDSNGAVVVNIGSISDSIGHPKVPPVIGGGGGFLLADLTPIAVANFRTAPPPQPLPLKAGANTRGEHDPLLQPSPSSPGVRLPDDARCRSSSSTPTDFNVAVVADMKREPPSGGSIHDESDGDHGDPTLLKSMIPSPDRDAIFFAQIPSFNLHGQYCPPLRDFHHSHRRPPSPALGPGFYRFGRGRVCGHGYGQPGVFGEGRLGRLAPSHSFAYHPDSAATEWLLRRRTSSGLARFSPPPQRIQAIVPEVERKVGQVAEGMKLTTPLSGETPPAHQTKSLIFGVSSERILPPRQRTSLLGQRSTFSPSVGMTEQADAYTQTTASSNDTRSCDATGATACSKRRRLSGDPLSPLREPRVDLERPPKSSSPKSTVEFPTTSLTTVAGNLSQPVQFDLSPLD
ncbi:hypothetical protein Aperf_G00000068096 [Anoplocephala perfoliata]